MCSRFCFSTPGGDPSRGFLEWLLLFSVLASPFPLAAHSASAPPPPHSPAGCCGPVTASSVLASRMRAMVLRAVGTPASFLGIGAPGPASEAEIGWRPMGKKGRNTDHGWPPGHCATPRCSGLPEHICIVNMRVDPSFLLTEDPVISPICVSASSGLTDACRDLIFMDPVLKEGTSARSLTEL